MSNMVGEDHGSYVFALDALILLIKKSHIFGTIVSKIFVYLSERTRVPGAQQVQKQLLIFIEQVP